MPKLNVAIMGGDKRTAYMVPILKKKGCNIICYGLQDLEKDTANRKSYKYAASLREAVESSDVIVGGIPFTKKGKFFSTKPLPDGEMEEFLDCLQPGQRIFAGVIPEKLLRQCEEKEVACYDFMKEETIAVFNGIATAEGAILEAMRHQEMNIHHSKSLVLGYGRCGKVLAEKLKGLSAEVTVCSRCEVELALAEAMGSNILPLNKLRQKISMFEYIYNTIPALILKEVLLKRVKDDVLIVDIASGEGGVDYSTAEALGVHAIHCLGLPGKYAAKTSAKCLAEYVLKKI